MLESNYSGQYEEPLLEKAISWIDNIVLSWLQFAFGSESKKGKSRLLLDFECTFSLLCGAGLSSQIDLWKDRLHHLVYKAFSSMRQVFFFSLAVA